VCAFLELADSLAAHGAPRLLVQACRRAAGDSILAHINPAEAKILQLLGGRGTPNPVTGAPEFALKREAFDFNFFKQRNPTLTAGLGDDDIWGKYESSWRNQGFTANAGEQSRRDAGYTGNFVGGWGGGGGQDATDTQATWAARNPTAATVGADMVGNAKSRGVARDFWGNAWNGFPMKPGFGDSFDGGFGGGFGGWGRGFGGGGGSWGGPTVGRAAQASYTASDPGANPLQQSPWGGVQKMRQLMGGGDASSGMPGPAWTPPTDLAAWNAQVGQRNAAAWDRHMKQRAEPGYADKLARANANSDW